MVSSCILGIFTRITDSCSSALILGLGETKIAHQLNSKILILNFLLFIYKARMFKAFCWSYKTIRNSLEDGMEDSCPRLVPAQIRASSAFPSHVWILSYVDSNNLSILYNLSDLDSLQSEVLSKHVNILSKQHSCMNSSGSMLQHGGSGRVPRCARL